MNNNKTNAGSEIRRGMIMLTILIALFAGVSYTYSRFSSELSDIDSTDCSNNNVKIVESNSFTGEFCLVNKTTGVPFVCNVGPITVNSICDNFKTVGK